MCQHYICIHDPVDTSWMGSMSMDAPWLHGSCKDALWLHELSMDRMNAHGCSCIHSCPNNLCIHAAVDTPWICFTPWMFVDRVGGHGYICIHVCPYYICIHAAMDMPWIDVLSTDAPWLYS